MKSKTPAAYEIRISGFPNIRKSGFPDFRISGFPDIRISGFPEIRIFLQIGNQESSISKTLRTQ